MSATTVPVVAPVPEAAARARRQATAVAAVGAIVPTILAAQGMTSLAVDLLGFPIVAAVALAGFLELALVASALLARAAALAGRPGGADALAVWVVSGTSGLLAGVHELVVTTPDGPTTWSVDPGSVLAAAVRVVAPLVAAWLWERVLQAARAEQAERTLAEVRRDRRFLDVARAALAMRRLEAAGLTSGRRARRAARRLDRSHVAALRVAPPAPTLAAVLAAVGQVDHLPAATSVPPIGGRTCDVVVDEEPDTQDDRTVLAVLAGRTQEAAPGVLAASGRTVEAAMAEAPDTLSSVFSGAQRVDDFAEEVPEDDRTANVRPAVAAAAVRPATVTAQVADQVADTEALLFEDVPLFEADVEATATETEAEADDAAARLALAAELMRTYPEMTGSRLAVEMTQRGHATATRSGQRWRGRALAAMAEPVAVA